MNKEEKNIINTDCNCSKTEINEIRSVVDEVISITGGEKEKVILILQEVQKRLNYVPSDALKYICQVSDITPGQISGVSTFYSQFRHLPVGRHTIKICTGTACHVKGSQLITESFQRELGIDDTHNMSEDSLFSIEEVACLGCCTLAPVIQIDGKTYGHVKPNMTGEIINDFLSTHQGDKAVNEDNNDRDTDAEVRIGLGSCCVAGGSRDILSNLIDTKESYNLKIRLKPVGCVGVCNQTPLLEIVTKDNVNHRYTNVKKEQVEEILLKHIKPASFNKRLLHRLNDLADTFVSDEKSLSPVNLSKDVREKYLNNFLNLQLHLATMNSGIISPESFEEYRMLGGFNALEKTVAGIAPVEVINIVNNSMLRGRGGAGFPTGKKWKIFSEAEGNPKYVVCNGDEGDPGAFMDRMLLESFPYRIIEGMLIAGFATGAQEGIFYIRAEYPLAVSRIRTALENCYKNRMLGKDSKYSDFRFNITIFEGAGAFVCGEETALIASLEGKRGYPHFRPPYPVEKGYNGKPTLVNNVETLSLIPWILNNGSDSFNSIGTEKSKGTKVFALAGKVSKGGLIEVPMGTTIREIVENIGNGVGDGRSFKSVQIGGPSGGCIPASLSDTPVDFEQLTKLGAMMGSGGMVVLDDSDCMVDIAKYFLSFTHKQSCGKCTFCRVGTKQMLNILTLLSEGNATMADIDELERLSHDVKNGSLCGLGKTAPNPVLTGLQYFREEYEAHTRKICPAKKCRELIRYVITDNCTGCTKCYQECPVGAIEFKPYEKHNIDNAKCTKCDNCRIVCPENAVEIININEDKN